MPIQKGESRNQLEIYSLESIVAEDSEVRVIDLFLDLVDFDELGFEDKGRSHEGRPAFAADVLLGIYIYGYLNEIRSSRKLARACQRNVELWWLTGKQMPKYKTIADFRKNNSEALNKLFGQFRSFCKGLGLYGGKTIAIDGSKFRGQNSKKNNFNAGKIARQLDYIEQKRADYIEALNHEDQAEGSKDIKNRLGELDQRQQKYERLEAELEQSGDTQISTSDPDCRALPLHMNIVEVGYNVQTSVDAKHNLIVDYEVTNEKDDYALSEMGSRALEVMYELDDEPLTILADKGYHTAEELDKCEEIGLDTLVAPKEQSKSNSKGYTAERFTYDEVEDAYTCPAGKKLKTSGKWHIYGGKNRKPRKVKRYSRRYLECKDCPHFERCVPPGARKQKHGKTLLRSNHAGAVERNKKRVKERKEEYRRRQAIVEAYQRGPFTPLMRVGTIKRQWGYSYTLLKGKKKVQSEFSLIYLCYNLRRIIKILGLEGVKEALKREIKDILKEINLSCCVEHLSNIILFKEVKFFGKVA
jgi:transposase